jgi:hypothetical protein
VAVQTTVKRLRKQLAAAPARLNKTQAQRRDREEGELKRLRIESSAWTQTQRSLLTQVPIPHCCVCAQVMFGQRDACMLCCA